jgi:hypothetical protein
VTQVCFLTPSGGNAFMDDILRAVADAVAAEGADASFATDRYPPEGEADAYVAIPHEFFPLAPGQGRPTPGQLRRTIGFCVEQPGTRWFGTTWHYAKSLGALMDIRRSVARELSRNVGPTEHFQLGYRAAWDHWRRDESATRSIDVLYLGSHDDRRARMLAHYTDPLQERSTELLIPPEAPKSGPRPDFLLGPARWRKLAAARTILNVHRANANRFERPRVLESICNGCVVVSEHSVDVEPLEAGEHFLSGSGENLALLAAGLLDDEPRLAEMRLRAYDFARSELSMGPSAQRLIAIAEHLAHSSRRARGAPPLTPERSEPSTTGPATEAVRPVRAALKQVSIQMVELRRRMEALELGIPWADARGSPDVVAESAAYSSAAPRVTVAIPLYNYEAEVVDALSSVAASDSVNYEIVVLDDGSTDGSTDAVRGYLAEQPWVPAVLLRHAVNCGLGRTRNAIVERARGEYVFMLDADNEVYPSTLGRLIAALDHQPDAMFAYPTIAVYEYGEPSDLLSAHAWDPELLRTDNFIDAMALLRCRDLRELGGYAEDPRLVGWEDYDLWCRAAEAGRYGVHVPEILARYRRSAHSLLNLTELDLSVARSLIAGRAPTFLRATEHVGSVVD